MLNVRHFLLLAATCVAGACNPVATAAPTPVSSTAPSEVIEEVAQATPSSQPTSQPSSQPTAPPVDSHNGSQGAAGSALPANLEPGQVGHFGAPFAIDGDPLTLAAALETCANTGTPCKIAGTIERVCQNRGCWFTLDAPDVDRTVRVRMQDYGFFVPRNAMGAQVVLEGLLSAEEEPQELAQHFADDEAAAGTAPAQVVTGPQLTYQLMITGAQVTQP